MKKTLQQLREEREWTQFDLAVKSGVSLSTISNIETGRSEPRMTAARKLAAAFGVAIDDIAWPEVERGTSPKAEPTAA